MNDSVILCLVSIILALILWLVIVEWRWKIFSLRMKLRQRDIWVITKTDIAVVIFATLFIIGVIGFGIWGLVSSL